MLLEYREYGTHAYIECSNMCRVSLIKHLDILVAITQHKDRGFATLCADVIF